MNSIKYTTLISLVSLASCFGKTPEKTSKEGKSLPSFNLLLADSTTYFNTKNIPNGQPVVLFCFSPECPYCRVQMEEIIETTSSLKDIRFYIFTAWPFSEMKGFYTRYQLYKYPNIVVGVDYTNFFVGYFKAQGVPYMAIYGKDKRLNNAFIGNIHSKQLKEVAEN